MWERREENKYLNQKFNSSSCFFGLKNRSGNPMNLDRCSKNIGHY